MCLQFQGRCEENPSSRTRPLHYHGDIPSRHSPSHKERHSLGENKGEEVLEVLHLLFPEARESTAGKRGQDVGEHPEDVPDGD